MGLNVKVGSIALTASTGSLSITGVGFQPSIVIFEWADAGVGATSSAIATFGYAVSSSDRRCFGFASLDSAAPTQVYICQRDDACVAASLDGSTFAVKIDFTSMDLDGFTLNVINTVATSRISYLAIGGADLTNVKGGAAQRPTANGSQSVTGLGFKPDCVILFAGTSTVTNPLIARRSSGGFIGWGTGSSARAYTSFYSGDNLATSDATGGNQTTAIATYTGAAAAISAQADLTSLDASGFTLNWGTTNATAGWFYYIALKGCNFSVGTLAQPGSNGQQTVTGLGFIPQAVLFQGCDAVAQAPTANSRLSLGMASSNVDRNSIWTGDLNGVATSNSSRSYSLSLCINDQVESHGSPTTSAAADFQNFLASGGFAINWTTTDATARITQYLAIGGLTPQGVFWSQ